LPQSCLHPLPMIGNAVHSGGIVTDKNETVWRVDVLCTVKQSVKEMLQVKHPCILQDASAPYKIVAANLAWRNLCGFNGTETIGATTKILQGKRTDQVKARRFRDSCLTRGAGRTTLVNYTQNGRPFCHSIYTKRVGASRGYFVTRSTEVTDGAIKRALLGRDAPVASAQSSGSDIVSIGTALMVSAIVILFDGQDDNTGALSAITVIVLLAAGRALRTARGDMSARLETPTVAETNTLVERPASETAIAALVLLPLATLTGMPASGSALALVGASTLALFITAQAVILHSVITLGGQHRPQDDSNAPPANPMVSISAVLLALLLTAAVLLAHSPSIDLSILTVLTLLYALEPSSHHRGLPPSLTSSLTSPLTSATSSGMSEVLIAAAVVLPALAVLTTALAQPEGESTAQGMLPLATCWPRSRSLAGCFGTRPPLTLGDPLPPLSLPGPRVDPLVDRYLYGSPWMGI